MKTLQMGKDPVHKLLFQSAFPAVIGMLLQSVYMMIDGMFVGRGTGPLGLAAVNLSMPVLQLGTAIAFMLVIGGSTYTAIALGENNRKKASQTFSLVGCALLITAVLFALGGLIFADQLATLTGAGPDIHGMVTGYLRILSLSMPFFMTTMLLESGLRVTGKPMVSMAVLSLGAVVNIGLDWLFIMKLGLGVNGAAVATGLSQLLSTAILFSFYRNPNSVLRLNFVKIDWKRLQPILLNGSSEFVTGIALGVSTYLFNLILMRLEGSLAVSAYSIVNYISQLVFMVQYGIASGMQPIVSYNYGAEAPGRYKSTLKLSLMASAGAGLLASVLLYNFALPLTKLFIGSQSDLLEITLRASLFVAFMYVPAGINIIMSGYYTAVDKPVESAGIALLRGLVFLIAGLYILPDIYGLDGVWATLPGAELLTVLACLFLVLKSPKTKSIRSKEAIRPSKLQKEAA